CALEHSGERRERRVMRVLAGRSRPDRPREMSAPGSAPPRRARGVLRRVGVGLAIALIAGLLVFAVSRLDLHRIGHELVTASPGWIALALVLMGLSLVLRSVSWQQTLRAALPEAP